MYFILSPDLSENFSSGVYIFIILFIFFALLSRKNEDYINFPKYVLIISTLSTIITFITTPLDIVHWIPYGGRLYVGDTENPNLTSFIALMNVLSIIFHIRYSQKAISVYMKFIYLIIALCSIYLYFLSFSKSALLGFLLALLVLIPLRSYFNRTAVKILGSLVILLILSILLVPSMIDQIATKFSILSNAFNSYFYGEYSNLAADSAAIRHENLNKMFELLPRIDLIYGNGMFMTRADLPILQVFTDLGIITGILNLLAMLLAPLVIFFRQYYNLKTYTNDPLYPLYIMSVTIFLFYFPNLFFHGTPYELSIWLPILILYKFAPWNKKRNHA